MNQLPDPLSPEDRFRTGLAIRIYRVLLGRAADHGGLLDTVHRLRTGVPIATIVDVVLKSEEFRAAHPVPATTTQEIDVLFRSAYGYAPPVVERGLPPAGYAAKLLYAAERREPTSITDTLYPQGFDPADDSLYRLWADDFFAPNVRALQAEAAHWPPTIAVSIVLLGGWSAGAPLQATLRSLASQVHQRFDLVAAGGRSFCAAVTQALPAATTVLVRPTPLADALNAARGKCRGRFLLVVQPGTRLAPDAVWHITRAADDDPSAAALLLDHDHIDGRDLRSAPTFHAGWDPEVALSRTDWAPGVLLRTDLAAQAGGADPDAAAAGWPDLALRVIEAAGHERVRHVARPLLHIPRAGTLITRLPARLAERARHQAWERLVTRRLGVHEGSPRLLPADRQSGRRVVYTVPAQAPLVSVIVPTRDRVDLLRPCIDGLLNRTAYKALEIILIDNRSEAPETRQYLQSVGRDPRVRVLRHDAQFNWGAINNIGVRMSQGEILLLLNNDTDVLQADWLDELVGQALRPEVGAVGAKLLYQDRTVQHAGLTLGPDGHSFHRFRHVAGNVPGYRGELAMVRSVTAVTGACLAMRRAVYDEVQGIEEAALTVTWSDVDLCFRIRAAGYRVICTPFAPLLHLELATRGADDTPERAARAARERQFMMQKWPALADEDRFFNPSFRLWEEETRLACPPRQFQPAGLRRTAG
ncbi:MAG: glycosyltransferase family 2 protein [Proteobacteria bacterium]|nr:glycosyltransferase family 2 protein [Pseudomonadota bacterium]